jgi:hypothetical protein
MRILLVPEDEGASMLRNVGKYPANDRELQSRQLEPSEK